MAGITSVMIINSTGLTGGPEGKIYKRTNCNPWKTQRPSGNNCRQGGEKHGREIELAAKNLGI